ncbi:MAG: prenyltransferase/squalene oxidase repeat-containing protein [Anaerolineae bacterium]
MNAAPLPWLLEPVNPSVRYWTLVDVLGYPDGAPEVQDTRGAIAEQALVKEVFALQHPDGHWGEDATKPYTAQGAVAALGLLHMLGVAPDERTAAGCASFLRFCQSETGGFSLTRTLPSGVFPCTTGEHKRWLTFGVPRAWDLLSALKALAAHGYAHDARFAPLLALVLECQDAEGRWACGSVSKTWPLEKRNQPSKWVTLDALRVLKQAAQT